jgi:hypothetical protein
MQVEPVYFVDLNGKVGNCAVEKSDASPCQVCCWCPLFYVFSIFLGKYLAYIYFLSILCLFTFH